MWPLTATDAPLWLALYLATFALHAALVSAVLVGTGVACVAAIRSWRGGAAARGEGGARGEPGGAAARAAADARDARDRSAAALRARLPFLLGLGITAGVAPLLFLQLLYQRRFYTASLVLGPRWMAIVPALIAGFYALYVAKVAARAGARAVALALALACFAFVAWSWTELHLLMRDDAAWRAMYAAGTRIYADAGVAPRLVLWLGAALALHAALAVWWEAGAARRRLAGLALAGLAVAGAGAAWCAAAGAAAGAAHGWLYVLIAAVVVLAGAWGWMVRDPDGPAIGLVTGATAAALLAGVVVREAPRLALLEPARPAAAAAGGMPVFVATLALGAIAIGYVVRVVRGASSSALPPSGSADEPTGGGAAGAPGGGAGPRSPGPVHPPRPGSGGDTLTGESSPS
jgi:hypothetical protein